MNQSKSVGYARFSEHLASDWQRCSCGGVSWWATCIINDAVGGRKWGKGEEGMKGTNRRMYHPLNGIPECSVVLGTCQLRQNGCFVDVGRRNRMGKNKLNAKMRKGGS